MDGRRLAVLGTLVVLALPAALLVTRLGSAPTATPRAHDLDDTAVTFGRTVHVESAVPSTRFLPLGSAPEDDHTLSAQRAYNLLVSSSPKLSPIPATVRPYYGLLTAAATSPNPVHVRVWGFTVLSTCHDTTSPGAATSSYAAPCRLWEFVDARTGRNLGMITRQVLPE